MSSTEADVLPPLEADDPRTVGGYRLTARLGSGGMGRVYLSHTPAGRPVALKLIRPELSADPDFRRRFRHEVRAASRVQALHTAPVIDSDTDSSTPWLVTAYVPGPSLADTVLRHGRLPLPTVLLLVAGVAEALQAIHDADVVHRDLKPSNVLLSADGPRVIDFGIARAADATALTSSGLMIGTPSFMAPEQATGQSVTAASDIFALGQIAAYAASGSSAFGEGTSHAILYRIVHQEPDLGQVPAELRELVARCLAKEPAERPSVAEVIEACRAADSGGELRRTSGWLPTAVAAELRERGAASVAPPASTPAGPAPVPRPATPPPPLPPPGGGPPQPATTPSAEARPSRRRRLVTVVAASVLAVAAVGGAYALGAATADGGADERTTEADDAGKGGSDGGGSSGGGEREGSAPPSKAPDSKPDPEPVSYPDIDLTNTYHLYLGREQVAPRPSGSWTKDEIDFRYLNDQLRTRTGNRMALLPESAKGSLATCRSETRFALTLPVAKVDKATQICLHTADGHLALVTVKGFSKESDPSDHLSLDLTLWRGALDDARS